MLEIRVIPCLEDNYAYWVFDSKTKTSIIIDSPEFHAIDRFLESKNVGLDFILNTHHHWDHVSGNKDLKAKYNCKVFGSVLDSERIPEIDFGIEPNTPLELGDIFIKTFSVPGHTSHHVVFYIESENALFTGDTLFSMGCGRLFEGTYQDLFTSLRTLASLPEETRIYCGHEYSLKNSQFAMSVEPKNENIQKRSEEVIILRAKNFPTVPTTLKLEKQINPFLRCFDVESFTKLRQLRNTF